MLLRLGIRNVVLIESLDMDFFEGFSALTGETGAGKSILLDALGLALGERGDLSLVREGTDMASVWAEFTPAPHTDELLEKHSIPSSETLSLKRILQANGRSKAYVNGEPVSINVLREFGSESIEIHGQSDRLFDSASRKALLDRGLTRSLKDDLKTKFESWKRSKAELETFERRLAESAERQAFSRALSAEFDLLKPKENEWAELMAKRERVAGFAKIAHSVDECARSMTYPLDLAVEIANKRQILTRANGIDLKALNEVIQGLDRAYIEVKEAQNALNDLSETHRDQANELESIDQRLSELNGVRKKYGFDPNELFAKASAVAAELATLDDSKARARELGRAAFVAKEDYLAAAKTVSAERAMLATRIERAVASELKELFLPGARFRVGLTEVDESHFSADGFDRVSFEVSMNPGQPFTPLSKTASGGEMARLTLALKVAIRQDTSLTTIVFDEIDQGVSGAVALAIGERLRLLGETGQTMAITHSAQVASRADCHFSIEKRQTSAGAITIARRLSESERLDEVGRMLSGSIVTEAAKAAAKSLIDGEST